MDAVSLNEQALAPLLESKLYTHEALSLLSLLNAPGKDGAAIATQVGVTNLCFVSCITRNEIDPATQNSFGGFDLWERAESDRIATCDPCV